MRSKFFIPKQNKHPDFRINNTNCVEKHFSLFSAVFIALISISIPAFAQTTQDSSLAPSRLKKLTLEELMNLEVTSVSKRPEKLSEAASAIQVITSEDIRRSGAKTLPEALRLASNLQVAQVNSSQWAISARGFNNVLANKLLVLIDGRVIYTPLYAGVFWDAQNVLLEDVERIEVISGPGGTLWGVNAVNGVINIITKSSAETKGLFAEGGMGTNTPGFGSLRFGGDVRKNITCRIFGTAFKMGNTVLNDGSSANDDWNMAKGGFRLDWEASKSNRIIFQSNIYDGRPNPDGGDSSAVVAKGDNILIRWNHTISEKSDFQLQAYYDHIWRDFGNSFTEDLKTYDIDWQNRFQIGERNLLTYGLNARLMDHTVTNLELFGFFPGHKMLYLFGAFAQDEVMVIKEHLRVILGLKVENNSYTDFEYQPNGRITWTPNKNQTIWAAASRAVRTPSRIDRDFAVYLAPNFPFLTGSDSFISETVIAYELGWRVEPMKNLSISLATFYNVYDNIRSAEPGTLAPPYPLTIGNGIKGETYGAELSATYQLTTWWNMRGGYTHLMKDLSIKSDSKDMNGGTAESNDPENQFLFQTNINLPGHVEFGTVLRYIDRLPKPSVPDYMGLDVRIGWKVTKTLELNIVGQNLLDDKHPEFIPSSPAPRQIERSFYGKIICRL